ncbi:hypothetical protein K402DRAFT_400178 [Aulographum hederae CBS 113979]|uniref:Uncharacterized protein n=1 Tax=Aulographum hederae CBS 113979 TaxID=1176131 RepID=A0A6G1HDX0_9PEZI|nr:hypothetical protein K402DRAFT_400178 [Aulographum hederae CBS 113979]
MQPTPPLPPPYVINNRSHSPSILPPAVICSHLRTSNQCDVCFIQKPCGSCGPYYCNEDVAFHAPRCTGHTIQGEKRYGIPPNNIMLSTLHEAMLGIDVRSKETMVARSAESPGKIPSTTASNQQLADLKSRLDDVESFMQMLYDIVLDTRERQMASKLPELPLGLHQAKHIIQSRVYPSKSLPDLLGEQNLLQPTPNYPAPPTRQLYSTAPSSTPRATDPFPFTHEKIGKKGLDELYRDYSETKIQKSNQQGGRTYQSAELGDTMLNQAADDQTRMQLDDGISLLQYAGAERINEWNGTAWEDAAQPTGQLASQQKAATVEDEDEDAREETESEKRWKSLREVEDV